MRLLVDNHCNSQSTSAVQYVRLCINTWMSCQRNHPGTTPLKLKNLPEAEKELFPTTASLAKMLEPQAPPTQTSGTVSEDAPPGPAWEMRGSHRGGYQDLGSHSSQFPSSPPGTSLTAGPTR